MTRYSFVAAAVAALVSMAPATSQALDVQPGDYAWVGDGRTLGILYAQTQESDNFRPDNGAQVANSKMRAQVLVLRGVHYREIEGQKFAFHGVLPIGNLDRATIGGTALKTNDGIGDLTMGVTWFPTTSAEETGTTFGLSAFVTAPTGAFDSKADVNFGSGTWSFTPQVGLVQGLGNGFWLDAGAEANIYRNFSKGGNSYERKDTLQGQVYLRYQQDQATAYSVGYTVRRGGDLTVNGAATGQKTEVEQLRVVGSKFVTPTQQIQLMLGKDVAGEGGFKSAPMFEMRFTSVF